MANKKKVIIKIKLLLRRAWLPSIPTENNDDESISSYDDESNDKRIIIVNIMIAYQNQSLKLKILN